MIFVTVGTTSFDALVEAADGAAPRLAEEVTFQIGSGGYVPKNGKHFRYEDDLGPRLKGASVVISHGGAGSLFEALGAGCKVVGVENPEMQGHHQADLLEALEAEGALVWCRDLSRLEECVTRARALGPYRRPKTDLATSVRSALGGR